ncbi:hypothetical protein C9374_008405 [Naegleria lovaniensis]|uniref:Uncharacterized protein n=1 Tax=Naegleria lovaniensis TaxID=51637 RepID=A0AA88GF26_NAELO|nr:uncharacterized protein C9374_008405 [Naegleria lovaniensis]KAG2378262.1 hypothetical protein C9374_008405 [Naegleria lovaniensis]
MAFQLSQCLNCHDFFSPTNIYSLCVLKGDAFSHHQPQPHSSINTTTQNTSSPQPNSRSNYHSSDHLIFVATSNNIYVIMSNRNTLNNNQLQNNNSVFEQTIHKDFPIQEIPIYNISRIPTDSQIISISAFRSHYDKSKIVLGVTFTQPISYNEANSSKRKYDDEDDHNENSSHNDDEHAQRNSNNSNNLYNEEYFSSSYDSAGGGDSTDEDSLLAETHSKQSSTKKKKKKSNSSIIGKSFVSHSKMLKSNAEYGTNTNPSSGGNPVGGNTAPNSGIASSEQDTDAYTEQQQQFNNYLYIYLLDEDELFSLKNGSITSSSNTPNTNSTPSSASNTTMTKHKCIQTFILGYIPLGLTTQMVTLYPSMQQFPMFVLCGTDKSIHCFSDIIIQQGVSTGVGTSGTNVGYSLKLFDIPIVSNLFVTSNGRIVYLNSSSSSSSSSNTNTTGSNSSSSSSMDTTMNTSIMMNIPSSTSSSMSRGRNFHLSDNLFVEYDFANMMWNIPGSIIDLDYKHNLLIMGCQNGIVKGIQYSSSCSPSSFSPTQMNASPPPHLEFQFMLNSPISSISILNCSPDHHDLTFIVGEAMGRVVMYSIHLNSISATTFMCPNSSASCMNSMTTTTTSGGLNTSTTTTSTSSTTTTTITSSHSYQIEESTVIYCDEFGDSITCIHLLHYGESTSHQAALTEIYIGTYNKKLIVYQYDGESKTCSYKTTYHFEYPIYCVDSVDINNDGVKEIIVCTMYEIQILQPDLRAIGEYLKNKLLKRVN